MVSLRVARHHSGQSPFTKRGGHPHTPLQSRLEVVGPKPAFATHGCFPKLAPPKANPQVPFPLAHELAEFNVEK